MASIPIGEEEGDEEVPHVSSGRHVEQQGDSTLTEPLLEGAAIPCHEDDICIDELKSPHDGYSTAVQAV